MMKQLGGLSNLFQKKQIEEEVKRQTEEARQATLVKKEHSHNQLSGEQKFLMLLYLGLGTDITKNTQKAQLYSQFINLKESTIRPMFSNVTKYETEVNLNAIIDYFRSIKLNEKVRQLEDKLNKIRRK